MRDAERIPDVHQNRCSSCVVSKNTPKKGYNQARDVRDLPQYGADCMNSCVIQSKREAKRAPDVYQNRCFPCVASKKTGSIALVLYGVYPGTVPIAPIHACFNPSETLTKYRTCIKIDARRLMSRKKKPQSRSLCLRLIQARCLFYKFTRNSIHARRLTNPGCASESVPPMRCLKTDKRKDKSRSLCLRLIQVRCRLHQFMRDSIDARRLTNPGCVSKSVLPMCCLDQKWA